MASANADDVRAAAEETYRDVPNFLSAMNEHTGAPGAVYMAADRALTDGLLSPIEQQAVLLALSEHFDSRYDAVAHARLALDAGMSPTTVERILAGKLPRDDRLRALIEATRQTYDERGWLDAEALEHLQDRGVSRGELYEIFALHGMKTFSSFVNHLTDPDIDRPLQSLDKELDNVPEKPSTIEMRRLVLG